MDPTFRWQRSERASDIFQGLSHLQRRASRVLHTFQPVLDYMKDPNCCLSAHFPYQDSHVGTYESLANHSRLRYSVGFGVRRGGVIGGWIRLFSVVK